MDIYDPLEHVLPAVQSDTITGNDNVVTNDRVVQPPTTGGSVPRWPSTALANNNGGITVFNSQKFYPRTIYNVKGEGTWVYGHGAKDDPQAYCVTTPRLIAQPYAYDYRCFTPNELVRVCAAAGVMNPWGTSGNWGALSRATSNHLRLLGFLLDLKATAKDLAQLLNAQSIEHGKMERLYDSTWLEDHQALDVMDLFKRL